MRPHPAPLFCFPQLPLAAGTMVRADEDDGDEDDEDDDVQNMYISLGGEWCTCTTNKAIRFFFHVKAPYIRAA